MPSHFAQCKKCKEVIDLKTSEEKCIEDHECFDDDPCPLQGKFLKSAAQPTLENKSDPKNKP
jgi:hypothetical protein